MDLSNGHNKNLAPNLSQDCLGKQLGLPPCRSFLRLNFRLVMNYILLNRSNVTTNNTNTEQSRSRSDVERLECLIEELRASFDAICDQDYHEFVKSCDRNKHSAKTDKTRRLAKHIDHSIILNWGLIETAKYCLVQKLAPENSTTNQFLTTLKEELSKPLYCDNQFSRLTLLRFLQYLDKIILDRISDSSHRKFTLNVAENIEHFIDANRDILRTWFFKNRQVSARLALTLGDPAECWRSISHRLWSDMATKYSVLGQQPLDSIKSSPTSRISVSLTLMSLDMKQWRSNLELFALCAKELGDIDLIYGLKSLVKYSGLLGDEWDLIDLIANNMKSNYDKTYQDFMSASETKDANSTNVDQQSLLEFLNSCVELDELKTQSDKIAWLQSPKLKSLYEQYLESSTGAANLIQTRSRFDQVKNWITTWSFEPSVEAGPLESIGACTNLTLTTLMNDACRIESDTGERNAMIKEISDMIRSESTGKLYLGLDGGDNETAVLERLLTLATENEMPTKYVDNNKLTTVCSSLANLSGRECNLVHRLLKGLNNGDHKLTSLTRHDMDLIQHRAARFNLNHNNTEYALRLATDLDARNPDDRVRYHNKLTLLEATSSNHDISCYHSLTAEIFSSKCLDDRAKNRLLSKVFSRAWLETPKSLASLDELLVTTFESSGDKSRELVSDDTQHVTKIEQVVGKQNFPLDTLKIVAKTLDDQLSSVHNPSADILNASFQIDLTLLSRASESVQANQTTLLETAVRILDKIKKYGLTLNANNLATFSSKTFIDATIDCVWFGLRSRLISLITCCLELPQVWADALTLVIKRMATTTPESILFETLVNRMDLQAKLADSDLSRMSPSHQHRISETSILLQHETCPLPTNDSTKTSDPIQPEQCKRQLEFWDDIYKVISKGGIGVRSDGWTEQVLETEAFLREIRKISYLPGEYIKTLTTRMSRRLQQYLNLFKKYANPKTGEILNQTHLDECRNKLNAIYRHDSKSIDVLMTYFERSKTRSQVTIYDSSLSLDLSAPLKELDYRFKLMTTMKCPTTRELEMLIKSITELLSLCRAKVTAIHHAFKQKLYMEQISPFLSRLKSDLVIMPGYFLGGSGNCSSNGQSKRLSPITIHKISQSVQMIHSKTAPKKLTFIGSDGYSRPYLLKAHEDLRLDKLIMELFSSINLLLGGDKKTRDYNYQLQRYSVTPVSNRSGLIQWIEAPSLCSFYRSWFQSANGRRIVGRLYKETCSIVCPDPAETDEDKHNCVAPLPNQTIDPFYQLLWAKIRGLPRRGAQATSYDQVARPSSETTLKYRKEFPASVYEEVVERLVTILPQDLIAQQLWFDSPHSMGYYLRTKEFIRSCASISMVGYVIGLGDRHPDNILLDSRTGRVTHIDYNVCFEVGHQLSVAERVPFRLTQSMIHAFGFAGLEGGFKRSCERMLDLMKEFKSIILHHLDPINLSFMIGVGGTGGGVHVDDPPNNELSKVTNECRAQSSDDASKVVAGEGAFRRAFSDLAVAATKRPPVKRAPQMNLRSQEDDASAASLEFPTPKNVDSQHGKPSVHQPPRSASSQKLSPNQQGPAAGPSSSNQVQFDIKTPTMISPKHASDIYGRVKNKLAGNDELLLSRMYALRAEAGDPQRGSNGGGVGEARSGRKPTTGDTLNGDLILLIDEVQSTEEQVDALILEAISNKNKAAMFEGWSPWI